MGWFTCLLHPYNLRILSKKPNSESKSWAIQLSIGDSTSLHSEFNLFLYILSCIVLQCILFASYSRKTLCCSLFIILFFSLNPLFLSFSLYLSYWFIIFDTIFSFDWKTLLVCYCKFWFIYTICNTCLSPFLSFFPYLFYPFFVFILWFLFLCKSLSLILSPSSNPSQRLFLFQGVRPLRSSWPL